MKTEFEQNKKYKINLVLILSGDKTEKLVSKIRNKEIINLKNIEYYFIEEKRWRVTEFYILSKGSYICFVISQREKDLVGRITVIAAFLFLSIPKPFKLLFVVFSISNGR